MSAAKLKPAKPAHRRLRAKLEALAALGIEGERTAAGRKLARLLARYDWQAQDAAPAGDILAGRYQRAERGSPIGRFSCTHISNAVKWAIESACGVPCSHCSGEIVAHATADSCRRLAAAAQTIAEGFRVSWQHFATVPGVAAADQPLFFMGLYDGMMNETRPIGQRLPSPVRRTTAARAKRNAVAHAPGLELHPYTVAVGLGRQIRFAAPHAQLVETIERTLAGVLPAVTTK